VGLGKVGYKRGKTAIKELKYFIYLGKLAKVWCNTLDFQVSAVWHIG
jgi:hypothetical protein